MLPKTAPRCIPTTFATAPLGNRGIGLGMLARSFAGTDIAWVVDQSATRVAEAVALFGKDVRGSTDISAPLTDASVDIVIVAVPDYLHRMIAEPALRAGKHVFLEKPLATTAEDAGAILAAWQKSGRVLQLGYVLRQAAFYAAIRAVLREGALGRIRIASLSEKSEKTPSSKIVPLWTDDYASLLPIMSW